jgi:hypothetical protein
MKGPFRTENVLKGPFMTLSAAKMGEGAGSPPGEETRR